MPAPSWADDIDEFLLPTAGLPKPKESIDENGIITIEEYSLNDDGKKIKITKKIRRKIKKEVVEHAVAERRQWAKFGKEKGSKPGPQLATTAIGEEVSLKLTAGNKQDDEPTEEEILKENRKKQGLGNLKCRLCSGAHYTARCPYKDQLSALDSAADKPPGPEEEDEEAPAIAPKPSTGSKYVPPSMREGANRRAPAESMRRDDLHTLRVSNLSQEATDTDVREIFQRFGRIERVFVGRDWDTGLGKGYAFVSFENYKEADEARKKVDGLGYDNLILKCGWSERKEN